MFQLHDYKGSASGMSKVTEPGTKALEDTSQQVRTTAALPGPVWRKGADCIFMELLGIVHSVPCWGLATFSFCSVRPHLVLAASLCCAGAAATFGARHGEAVRGESWRCCYI